MDKYLNEKIKEFWGGFMVGGIAGVKFLFTGGHSWEDLALEYAIKFFAAIMFAFISGIFTVFAVDLYKHKLKDKLFPPKKTEEEKEEKK